MKMNKGNEEEQWWEQSKSIIKWRELKEMSRTKKKINKENE